MNALKCKTLSVYQLHVVNTIMHMRTLHRKMANCMYMTYACTQGVLDLCNRADLDNFGPLLPTEYVTVLLGQTDTAEVRCDLTDTDPTTVTLLHMHTKG